MADVNQHIEVLGLAAAGVGSFGVQALEWSAFFSTVAQVTGGLIGLVFVALTFNGKLARDGDAALHDLARQTFADFINVLVMSLLLLVPHADPVGVAFFMIFWGALGVLRILLSLRRMLRTAGKRLQGGSIIQRFLLSMLGNAGLLIAGSLLLRSEINLVAFWSTLFGSIIGLLVSGSRSAWLMVIPARETED